MEPIRFVNGNILFAVPAIHYRAVFAREVNRLCLQETSRPDAIAVELCPQMVSEIAGWMKELDLGPFKENMLPCMLGIMVKNRLIHPDFRETTLFLQEHFRRPLNELSPVIQKHLLHYSDQYLVSLSSTDSIIEAIRCAVELDIPVFGVDMEEFSAGSDHPQIIEDVGPSFNLRDWVNKNEKTAVSARDPYVDGRREKVMTARLKTILGEYKKVLFTGGLAHWLMIRTLLSDPAIRPAETMISDWTPKYTRTIIHPSLAVMFMDTYPVLTTRYEEGRRNPLTASEDPSPISDTGQVCRDILTDTYGKYFSTIDTCQLSGDQSKENHRAPDFERLLSLVSMVHHQKYPSMTDLLEVALSMMPLNFYKLLVSRLMEIGRPWASQAQFPGLPLISYVPFENKKGNYATSDELFHLTGTRNDDDDWNPAYRERSTPFSANYQAGNKLSKNLMRYWLWGDEPKKELRSGTYNSWVWPPCEALLYGTASAASKIARSQSQEPEPALFEGSLYDGLDIKASIRSVIKGEKRIYIRKPSSAKKTHIPDGKRPDPTVFIFCSDNQGAGSNWSLWLGGFNIGDLVKNKQRFEEIRLKKGSSFVASVAFNHTIPVPGNLQLHVNSVTMLDGTTIFGNPCINAKQAAEWVEDNDYQCCPVLYDTTGGIDTLVDYFSRTHQMEIETEDWHTALIQLAIPYARERVVIIAPEKFQVSRKLFSEAKRRKINLVVMSLNYFPADKIAEMRRRVLVRAIDSDGCRFPKDVETAMGQTADHYRELLPLYMQQQLKRSD